MDKDNSGSLDLKEVDAAFDKYTNMLNLDEASTDTVKKAFQKIDRDNSGNANLEEFKILFKVLVNKTYSQINDDLAGF